MAALKYRPDIDGLRAIAVIAVITFHMGFSFLPGGFSGVDVFFVISGYLISGIIFHDVEQNKFSLLRFYERRIKRIQPALFVMIFATSIATALIFTPVDFKFFAQSVGATVTFSSNIYFYIKSGYFDPLSETKPLLHTWSLAVEEQFYLFFPLLIVFLHRYAKQYRNFTLLVLAVCSFGLSVFQSRYFPDAAFYLPFDRFWELLLGAIVAARMLPTMSSPVGRQILGYLGLAAVLAGYFFLTAESIFPGEGALLSCVGASLIIYAEGNSLNDYQAPKSLLTYKPIVFLGKISYSLYLWHWPILVLAKYYLLRELTNAELGAYALTTFFLAWATWRFVERPFRELKSFDITRKKVFVGTATVTLVGIIFAGLVQKNDGMPERFGDTAQRYAAGALDVNVKRKQCDRLPATKIRIGEVCKLGADTSVEPTFVLIGDSFGDAISPGVDMAARELGLTGLVVTNSGCFPLIGINQIGHPECSKFNDAVLELVQSTPSITRVVLVGRWTSALLGTRFGQFAGKGWFITDHESIGAPGYAENRMVFERSLVRTVQAFGAQKVSIIAHIPEQRFDIPRALALNEEFKNTRSVDLDIIEHNSRQIELKTVLEKTVNRLQFKLVNVGNDLCDEKTCHTHTSNFSIYSDDNHLSTKGAIFLEKTWMKALTY